MLLLGLRKSIPLVGVREASSQGVVNCFGVKAGGGLCYLGYKDAVESWGEVASPNSKGV